MLKNPESIVHIQRTCAGLGDVIGVEPVVRYYIERGKTVNLLSYFHEVFCNYPSEQLICDFAFHYSLNQSGLAFFTHFRQNFINLDIAPFKFSKMHLLDAYSKEANIFDLKPSTPRLFLSDEEKRPLFTHDYALLHIEKNHFHKSRNIFGVNWKIIIDYLESKNIKLYQISQTGKDLVAPWVKTSSLRDLMSLIYNSKLYIGRDSGPGHIATVFNIPSLLFFGSVNPKWIYLNSENKVFLQSDCKFAHCYNENYNHPRLPHCRLVGARKNPPCCVVPVSDIINAIDSFIG